MTNRWAAFTDAERSAIHDGLLSEADLNPDEDPTFVERVATADHLLAELRRYGAEQATGQGG